MAAQYEVITLDAMDKVLKARQFERVDVQYSLEYVYDKKIDDTYTMRVFTSVDMRTNRSRSVGSDAIRIVIMRNGRAVSKETRVNRSEGWAIRLNHRIDVWRDSLVICPQCGNELVVRKSKYSGSFYGCITYPKCGYTEPIK